MVGVAVTKAGKGGEQRPGSRSENSGSAGRTTGQEGLGFQEIRAVGGGLNIWSTVEDNNSGSIRNIGGKSDRKGWRPGQGRLGNLQAGEVVVGR